MIDIKMPLKKLKGEAGASQHKLTDGSSCHCKIGAVGSRREKSLKRSKTI